MSDLHIVAQNTAAWLKSRNLRPIEPLLEMCIKMELVAYGYDYNSDLVHVVRPAVYELLEAH